MTLSQDLLEELKEAYDKVSNEQPVTRENIGEVFKGSGEALPGHRIRELMDSKGKKKDDVISFDEFAKLFDELDLNKAKGQKFKAMVKTREDVVKLKTGRDETSTMHSSSEAETRSFSNYINVVLAKDPECKQYLPISYKGNDLFKKCSDGILLCKLINNSVPNTVDERALTKQKLSTFTITENCTLAVRSSSAIGCHVVNIHSEDIKEGTPHLVLGLLWQIIKIGLFSKINIKATPNLVCLLKDYETIQDLLGLSPEELLMRWVNYQLEKASFPAEINNFTTDFADSSVYAALMEQIMPDKIEHPALHVNRETDMLKRGQMIVENAEKADVPALVQPEDIVGANQKLNMAFVAELFNLYPSLAEVENAPEIIETREEKSYRNWMNSLGVKPTVNDLYQDTSNGIVLLQLVEMLKPNCVQWDKINKPPFKKLKENLNKMENCNKFVELIKELGFSTVGLSGNDIATCSKMHALSAIWQMMSRYTSKILQELSGTTKPISEPEILKWANDKLAAKDIRLGSFKDPALSNAIPVLELIDILRPGTVNRKYVLTSTQEEDKLNNAKYAVSLARKIGANVYALPEDLVELKNKMIMTMFACLMIVDYQKK